MLLQDRFLNKHLNPLFIKSLKEFWMALEQAKESNPEQVKLAQVNLLRLIFRRLFQPLYFQYAPYQTGNVFLMTKVHTDGIGDYISLLKCAKILKQAHPHLNVHAAFVHYQEFPQIDTANYLLPANQIYPFLEERDEGALESILKGEEGDSDHPYHVQAKKLYEMLQESVAIVHIALALNTFDNPALAPKSFYFSETGNFQGIGNYLQRNWYSMGLQPFEEGIFLRKTFPSETPWINPRLPTLFKEAKTVHLGYLSKIPEQLTLFIYLILLLQKDKREEIYFLIPKLLKKGELNFNIGWLRDHGVSKMILHREKEQEVILETGLAKGKSLHFYPELPMAVSDFEKAVERSEEVVGCTGDGSLSDCLIGHKVPFYELRKHKQQTWEAFLMLAQFLQLKSVENYFKVLTAYKEHPLEMVAEELYPLVSNPAFKTEWNTLFEFIDRWDCFEEAFLAHLNRQFHITQNPSLKSKEEEWIQKFYDKKITSEEAYKSMEGELKKAKEEVGLK